MVGIKLARLLRAGPALLARPHQASKELPYASDRRFVTFDSAFLWWSLRERHRPALFSSCVFTLCRMLPRLHTGPSNRITATALNRQARVTGAASVISLWMLCQQQQCDHNSTVPT